MANPTNLQFALYLLVASELSLFLILGGTDFGAGIATFFVHDDQDRDAIVRTSGPVWGGNETWLVAGMAAMFGAFPHWYAALTSGFYLFFIFMLVCFMFRGVAFDYRKKWRSKTYNRVWDWGLFLGSLIPPFLLGIIFSASLRGVTFNGDFIWIKAGEVFNLFTLCSALFLVLLCIQIGLTRVRKRAPETTASNLKRPLKLVNYSCYGLALLEVVLLALNTTMFQAHLAAAIVVLSVLAIGLVLVSWNRPRISFWGAAVAIGSFSAVIFLGLYPNLISSTSGIPLTIMAAASGRESQLWVAFGSGMMLPLMIILQITAYHLIHKVYQAPDSEINY